MPPRVKPQMQIPLCVRSVTRSRAPATGARSGDAAVGSAPRPSNSAGTHRAEAFRAEGAGGARQAQLSRRPTRCQRRCAHMAQALQLPPPPRRAHRRLPCNGALHAARWSRALRLSKECRRRSVALLVVCWMGLKPRTATGRGVRWCDCRRAACASTADRRRRSFLHHIGFLHQLATQETLATTCLSNTQHQTPCGPLFSTCSCFRKVASRRPH